MTQQYEKAIFCIRPDSCISGEWEFNGEMQKQTDFDILLSIWTFWFDVNALILSNISSAIIWLRKKVELVFTCDIFEFLVRIPLFRILAFRYNQTGPPQKELYTRRVKMLNQQARASCWPDYGYYDWYSQFADSTIETEVLELYSKVTPLYKELHAYVRYKLSKLYPEKINLEEPIPAHLFGI